MNADERLLKGFIILASGDFGGAPGFRHTTSHRRRDREEAYSSRQAMHRRALSGVVG